eukprot:gene674-411_t
MFARISNNLFLRLAVSWALIWLFALRSKIQIRWLATKLLTPESAKKFFINARDHQATTRKVVTVWNIGRWALLYKVGKGTYHDFDRAIQLMMFATATRQAAMLADPSARVDGMLDTINKSPTSSPSPQSPKNRGATRDHEAAKRRYNGKDAQIFSIPPTSKSRMSIGLKMKKGKSGKKGGGKAAEVAKAHRKAHLLAQQIKKDDPDSNPKKKELLKQFLPPVVELPTITERDEVMSVSTAVSLDLAVSPYDILLTNYRSHKRVATRKYLEVSSEYADFATILQLPNLRLDDQQKWLTWKEAKDNEISLEDSSLSSGSSQSSFGMFIPEGATGFIYSWQQYDATKTKGVQDDLLLWLDGFGAYRLKGSVNNPIYDFLETKPEEEILESLIMQFPEDSIVRIDPVTHEYSKQLGRVVGEGLIQGNPFVHILDPANSDWRNWDHDELTCLSVFFPHSGEIIPVHAAWVTIIPIEDVAQAETFVLQEIQKEKEMIRSESKRPLVDIMFDPPKTIRLSYLERQAAVFHNLIPQENKEPEARSLISLLGQPKTPWDRFIEVSAHIVYGDDDRFPIEDWAQWRDRFPE